MSSGVSEDVANAIMDTSLSGKRELVGQMLSREGLDKDVQDAVMKAMYGQSFEAMFGDTALGKLLGFEGKKTEEERQMDAWKEMFESLDIQNDVTLNFDSPLVVNEDGRVKQTVSMSTSEKGTPAKAGGFSDFLSNLFGTA